MSRGKNRGRNGQSRYRPPRDLEYDEFIGELRLSTDGIVHELHVRYGERDDKYLDWALTLNVRVGGIDEIKAGNGPLERRTLEVVDVSDSAIRRHVFDPDDPDRPPRTTRLVQLRGDSHTRVNSEYFKQIDNLGWRLQQQNPGLAELTDRHNEATIGFVHKNREAAFRHGSLNWVRNTVVSIDSDLADVVISDRAYHYFPTSASTAAVLLPDGVMQCFKVGAAQHVPPEDRVPATEDTAVDGPITAHGAVTMGMLLASIYSGDWAEHVEDLLADE